jgi:hypothetical protein
MKILGKLVKAAYGLRLVAKANADRLGNVKHV